jgi:hypothetical protein
MSKSLTKSILINFSAQQKEEQLVQFDEFLKIIYSKLSDRSKLNVSCFFLN